MTSSPATKKPKSESPKPEPSEENWQRISPRQMIDEFITIGAVFALLLVVSAVLIVFDGIVSPLTAWLLFAVVFIGGVGNLIFIPLRVRAMRYLLRSDDFVFQRGVIFRRQVAVPYGRLQLIDINRGPLARVLGLAEVRLVTAAASSAISIPGVVLAHAHELRDSLIALAESRRAGL